MKIFSWRLILVVATAVSLIGYPKPASATTFDVTIGPGGNLVFSPSSVTIHPGDQVKLDLGFERPQHNVRLPGAAKRHLGFWNS